MSSLLFTRRATLIAATLLAGACATPDDAREVRILEPAPVVIALSAAENQPPVDANADLKFAWDSAKVRDALIAELTELRAATRIVAASSSAADTADIIIKPRFRKAAIPGHEGMSDSWWASGGLWLVTWIGGLFVQDSAYQTDLQLEFAIHHKERDDPIRTMGYSKPVELSFADRNGLMSWQTLQTFVLPPFWTSDNAQATSSALTSKMTRSVAIDLARYLKESYSESSLTQHGATLLLTSPKNDGEATVGSQVLFKGVLRASQEIEQAEYSVNSGSPRTIDLEGIDQNQNFSTFEVPFSENILNEVVNGENTIRIMFSAGILHTRTIKFRVGNN